MIVLKISFFKIILIINYHIVLELSNYNKKYRNSYNIFRVLIDIFVNNSIISLHQIL